MYLCKYHSTRKRGGRVYIATKSGTTKTYNDIDYYFDLNEYATLPQKRFDVIVASNLLMYFHNPSLIMNRLKTLLNQNGILIITMLGPAYPRSDGQMCFLTQEGVLNCVKDNFGNNYKNLQTYGGIKFAIHQLLGIRSENNMIDISRRFRKEFSYDVLTGVCCERKE